MMYEHCNNLPYPSQRADHSNFTTIDCPLIVRSYVFMHVIIIRSLLQGDDHIYKGVCYNAWIPSVTYKRAYLVITTAHVQI